MYQKNNLTCFFFDQVKPLRHEIRRNKTSLVYDANIIEKNKEVQANAENVDLKNNNTNDQLLNDTNCNYSSTKNIHRSITLTSTREKPTHLINKELISKQFDYYTWVEISGTIMKDLLTCLHQQNFKEIKHPRILDYRLDETWDELISKVDHSPRDWQLPAIKNAYNLWIQENPPEVDAYGIKFESTKKSHSSLGFEIATTYIPSPRGSVFRKQSSLTNIENMTIHVKTPNERKLNDMQYTSERISNAKKVNKDYSPPKILLNNTSSESSRSTQKLDSLKDSLKYSSVNKENESSLTIEKESKISISPMNRPQISSKHILSTGK
ncbi:unnamed protein product [Schistosoma turkestanicum]|nr:unnamed protein product [Schistosoma turkestanicum]